MKTLLAITTYGGFKTFVPKCVQSALVADCDVLLVDDGSQDYVQTPYSISLPHSGNLSKSWNYALSYAGTANYDVLILANSDVIFSSTFLPPMLASLKDADYVGAVTNAFGNCKMQNVALYVANYLPSDDPDDIEAAQQALTNVNAGLTLKVSMLNGFCFGGRVGSFIEAGGFDERIPMTGNETEFFQRCQQKSQKLSLALASFIFHYRGLSRGLQENEGLNSGNLALRNYG